MNEHNEYKEPIAQAVELISLNSILEPSPSDDGGMEEGGEV